MRTIVILAMLGLAGCNVENDPAKDQVTLKYDEARIKKSAVTVGPTAKEVGTGIANVAKGTGDAIKREVGDVDVDVKVSRNRSEAKQTAPEATP